MKQLLASFLFTIFTSALSAQSNKLDKKLEKATDLAKSGKLSEADDYLVDLLKENPGYGTGWDLLGRIRYKEYKDSKQMDDMLFSGNITVTTKDEKGNEVKKENDTMAAQLMDMLNKIKPSKKAFNKYTYTLRKATFLSNDAANASFLLRVNFIDPEVDTAVSKKALNYFNDAEEEFAKKNYENAASLYKRAITEQPDFYKASLYLGDCYYFTGNYVEAINSFKNACQKFPSLLEPHKYLVDAYAKEKLYQNSLDESINSLMIYPDLSMVMKMEDAAYFTGKKVDIKWMPRNVFPNSMKAIDESDPNKYEDPDKMEATGIWTSYANAAGKIKSFCDNKGKIIKATDLTKTKYLEVYSWEEMLKNNLSDHSLDEARRMEKDGYLDCYALITCFHFDLYEQYTDFVSKNREKVNAYFKKYMVTL